VVLVVQAVAEGGAKTAEGLSPTTLCWRDLMVGEIRVVMRRMEGVSRDGLERGTVGKWDPS
jgi:hypothetical protein